MYATIGGCTLVVISMLVTILFELFVAQECVSLSFCPFFLFLFSFAPVLSFALDYTNTLSPLLVYFCFFLSLLHCTLFLSHVLSPFPCFLPPGLCAPTIFIILIHIPDANRSSQLLAYDPRQHPRISPWRPVTSWAHSLSDQVPLVSRVFGIKVRVFGIKVTGALFSTLEK